MARSGGDVDSWYVEGMQIGRSLPRNRGGEADAQQWRRGRKTHQFSSEPEQIFAPVLFGPGSGGGGERWPEAFQQGGLCAGQEQGGRKSLLGTDFPVFGQPHQQAQGVLGQGCPTQLEHRSSPRLSRGVQAQS